MQGKRQSSREVRNFAPRSPCCGLQLSSYYYVIWIVALARVLAMLEIREHLEAFPSILAAISLLLKISMARWLAASQLPERNLLLYDDGGNILGGWSSSKSCALANIWCYRPCAPGCIAIYQPWDVIPVLSNNPSIPPSPMGYLPAQQ